jgi:hypothetical protein
MKDDYLWDKSGEPDPEIRELEEILAPLRYQPKPLELPGESRLSRPRTYLPLLAIAATVLIALLAAGVWLRLRTEESIPPQQEAKSAPSVPAVLQPELPSPGAVQTAELPRKPPRRHKQISPKYDRQEALAAKEQVMLALRLASEKLKLAQRRTQAPSLNQIKNQHRVG